MALFVGRLPQDTRQNELEELFEPYGEITRCDVKKRYAFVTFKDDRDAKDALEALDGLLNFLFFKYY